MFVQILCRVQYETSSDAHHKEKFQKDVAHSNQHQIHSLELMNHEMGDWKREHNHPKYMSQLTCDFKNLVDYNTQKTVNDIFQPFTYSL